MKILTKEEEQAHYNATLKGGITGGGLGLALGTAVVFAASKRFHTFNQLTLPMKTFLVTSSTTFAAIISADKASRGYETERDPARKYRDRSQVEADERNASQSESEKLKEWARENRYSIVGASWLASMGAAMGIVSRNKYLTGTQKLVQARVYAQGLTLAVLIATAAFETADARKGQGRWETIKVLDPNDPEHKHMIEKKIHHESYAGEDLWRDMVESEERKLKSRKAAAEQGQDEGHRRREMAKESGKEAKDKILSQSKSAGKVDYDEAAAIEEKNQKRQNEKEADAHQHAAVGPKNKGRGEIA